MSIKKRLFYSNLLMVLIPLLVIFAVIGVFESSIRVSDLLQNSTSNELNEAFVELQDFIANTDGDRLLESAEYREAFLNTAGEYGFHIQAAQNSDILFSNWDANDAANIERFGINLEQQVLEFPVITHYIGASTFACTVSTGGNPIYITALYFEGSTSLGMLETDLKRLALQPSTIVLLISVIVIIIVNVVLSSRMVVKIMVPVNKLLNGAERIKQGDLSENIHYSGKDELSRVCDSFNEMQDRLRDNINKNIAYEQRQREMIAGISHDLRTPLTSIKSYVKGLKDGVAQTGEKRQSYLDIIYLKTGEMESLIENLFQFAKLETGSVPLHLQWVCLNQYLATYLDKHIDDYKMRGVSLVFHDTPQKLMSKLDGNLMGKVFENIMENSIKYAVDDQIIITVSLQASNESAIIRVKDNGPGVPVECLMKLFESFYRVDDARSNSTDGSGLGLSIAKHIIEKHGGKIYAENDNGLAVMIELPVEKEEL